MTPAKATTRSENSKAFFHPTHASGKPVESIASFEPVRVRTMDSLSASALVDTFLTVHSILEQPHVNGSAMSSPKGKIVPRSLKLLYYPEKNLRSYSESVPEMLAQFLKEIPKNDQQWVAYDKPAQLNWVVQNDVEEIASFIPPDSETQGNLHLFVVSQLPLLFVPVLTIDMVREHMNGTVPDCIGNYFNLHDQMFALNVPDHPWKNYVPLSNRTPILVGAMAADAEEFLSPESMKRILSFVVFDDMTP